MTIDNDGSIINVEQQGTVDGFELKILYDNIRWKIEEEEDGGGDLKEMESCR